MSVPKSARVEGAQADALEGSEVTVAGDSAAFTAGKLERREKVSGDAAAEASGRSGEKEKKKKKEYDFFLRTEDTAWHQLPSSRLPWVATAHPAGGRVMKIQLEPLEYSIGLAVGHRLRIVSAIGAPSASVACCTTVTDFSQEAARASCVVDNSEMTVQLELLPAGPPKTNSTLSLKAAPWHLEAKMVPDGTVVAMEIMPASPPYKAGRRLAIVPPDGTAYVDATVESAAVEPLRPTRHRVKLANGSIFTLDLNQANHCKQRFASMDDFEQTRLALCEHVREATAIVQDAITGTDLAIADQSLHVSTSSSGGVQRTEWNPRSVKELAPLLVPVQEGRPEGALCTQSVLVVAEAGTGKTWSSYQLAHEAARLAVSCQQGVRPVPLLCFVQRLARMLRQSPASRVLTSTVVLQYVVNDLADRPEFWALVAQAMEMRSLQLFLDGIDEAAGRRAECSRLLRLELLPMGLTVVATSRPEGVDRARFERSYVILRLEPLSTEETRLAVEGLLKGSCRAGARVLGPSPWRPRHPAIARRALPRGGVPDGRAKAAHRGYPGGQRVCPGAPRRRRPSRRRREGVRPRDAPEMRRRQPSGRAV